MTADGKRDAWLPIQIRKFTLILFVMSVLCLLPNICLGDVLVVDEMDRPCVEQAVKAFEKENPHIALKGVNLSLSSDQTLIERIVTRNADVDIYCIDTQIGLDALKRKGYFIPLESDVIRACIEKMYPSIQAIATFDQEIVCVPIQIETSEWAVHRQLRDEFGLENCIPESYLDFIEWISGWIQDSDVQEDYNVVTMGIEKKDVLTDVLLNYILQMDAEELPLDFSRPDFVNTLTAIRDMPDWTNVDGEEWNTMINRPTIIEYMPPSIEDVSYETDWLRILPPCVDRGCRRVLPARLTLYVVNPFSKNKICALQFLEAVVTHMDDVQAMKMNPGANQPIENAQYDRMVKGIEDKIEFLTRSYDQALKGGDEGMAAFFQMQIESAQSDLDDDRMKYWVTEEEIEQYRGLAPNIAFGDTSPFLKFSGTGSFDSLYDIAWRYCSGFGQADRTIAEMNQCAQMIVFEGE